MKTFTTVFRFTNHRYDTSSYEPPKEHLTVMRAIEVSDSNVFNALVDQTQMESILLIESDDLARQIMYNEVSM